MRRRITSGIAVGLFVIAACDWQASAGQIHIRYDRDAPERMAAANAVYYEGLLNLAHNHPKAFAREHPFYTKMFNDPAMLNRLIDRWEANEQRFEYWHDCLWKVLDGYLYTHPPLPPPIGSTTQLGAGGSPSSGGVEPQNIPGGNGGNNNNGGGGTGGHGIQPFSVPEPSSFILMAAGLAILAARYGRYRRVAG